MAEWRQRWSKASLSTGSFAQYHRHDSWSLPVCHNRCCFGICQCDHSTNSLLNEQCLDFLSLLLIML